MVNCAVYTEGFSLNLHIVSLDFTLRKFFSLTKKQLAERPLDKKIQKCIYTNHCILNYKIQRLDGVFPTYQPVVAAALGSHSPSQPQRSAQKFSLPNPTLNITKKNSSRRSDVAVGRMCSIADGQQDGWAVTHGV